METSFTPLKKYKTKVILCPFVKMIECVFELASPFVVRYIIDDGIKASNWDVSWKLSLILFAMALLGFGVTLIAQWLASRTSADYGFDLKNSIHRHIDEVGEKEIEDFGKDKALNLISNDSFNVQTGLAMFMRLFIRAPFMVFGSLIISFVIDWKAGLIFLLALGLSSLIIFLVIVLSPKKYADVQKDLDSLSVISSDSFSGIRPMRAFGQSEEAKEKFFTSTASYRQKNIRLSYLNSFINPLTFFFVNMAVAFIVYFGSIEVGVGDLSTGQVISLIGYLSTALAALVMFSRLIVSLNKAKASKVRIDSFLAIPSQGFETRSEKPLKTKNLVSFKNVSFSYNGKNGSKAVSDISFDISIGESVGIIGGTGSGKSTIVSLLSGLYEPTEGTILFYSKPINEVNSSYLLESLNVVLQKSSLFAGTIKSNLLLGNPTASDDEINQALKDSLSESFVNHFPEGLDHPVEERGSNLSGGQKQRLLLARAFLKGGDLLVLDDCLSALDYLSEAAIRKTIREKKLATLTISQRTSSLKDCDHILVIEDGKILAEGTHKELLISCPFYKEIHDTQAASR